MSMTSSPFSSASDISIADCARPSMFGGRLILRNQRQISSASEIFHAKMLKPGGSDSRFIKFRPSDGRLVSLDPLYLRASSSVFADMLGDISQADQNDTPPIDVDTPYAVLGLFLDLMHNRDSPTSTYRHRDELLRLCDKFDCVVVRDRVILTLYDNVHRAPWQMFAIASNHDIIGLAKAAIREFGQLEEKGEKLDFGKITLAMAKQISTEYFLGLGRAMEKLDRARKVQKGNDGRGVDQRDWSRIARLFSPVKT